VHFRKKKKEGKKKRDYLPLLQRENPTFTKARKKRGRNRVINSLRRGERKKSSNFIFTREEKSLYFSREEESLLVPLRRPRRVRGK